MRKRKYSVFNTSEAPRTKEKILVDDEIHYVPNPFIQHNLANNINRITATVISVNPEDTPYRLELSTADLIDETHMIRRTMIIKNNNLVYHPGIYRQISSFFMVTQQKFTGSSVAVMKMRTRSIVDECKKNTIKKSPKELKGLVQAFISPHQPSKRNRKKTSYLI